MVWRKTGDEFRRDTVIRALRRDVSNGGRGWGKFIAEIADKLASGEYKIVEEKQDAHVATRQ